MKIALIQMNSGSDKEANILTAVDLITQVVTQEQPDWVCLPEAFDLMGGSKEAKFEAAEIFPNGPAYARLQELAHRYKIFIHAGSMLERHAEPQGDEERLSNTTLVFNREGQEIARYRKIHLFDVRIPSGVYYAESAILRAGDVVVTYPCEEFTVGCAICYDLRFPNLFQALMEKGADLIALPAAFTLETGKDHWEVLCRARAIETESFVCAAAQTGSFLYGQDRRMTYGNSLVIDPWGIVVARASSGVGYITHRLDRARVEAMRDMIPIARHKLRFA